MNGLSVKNKSKILLPRVGPCTYWLNMLEFEKLIKLQAELVDIPPDTSPRFQSIWGKLKSPHKIVWKLWGKESVFEAIKFIASLKLEISAFGGRYATKIFSFKVVKVQDNA